jgi:peroxiredoxin
MALNKPPTLAEAFEAICVMDASLNDRLAAYAERLKELNFPFSEAYDTLVSRLIEGEVGATAPNVGEVMPAFLLPGPDGRLYSLDELCREGPVVLSFNRGHWCPFCKIELRTIAQFHDEISAHGGQVVSIVPDRQQFVKQLRSVTAGTLIILSDIDNGYSLTLGLVMWLGDKLHELMLGRGFHLETYQGNDGWFVPVPATFVLDRRGIVVARHVDPDFRTRMGIRDILAALGAANRTQHT